MFLLVLCFIKTVFHIINVFDEFYNDLHWANWQLCSLKSEYYKSLETTVDFTRWVFRPLERENRVYPSYINRRSVCYTTRKFFVKMVIFFENKIFNENKFEQQMLLVEFWQKRNWILAIIDDYEMYFIFFSTIPTF